MSSVALSPLPVTGVFVAIGHEPVGKLVRGAVDTDADGYVLVRGSSRRNNARRCVRRGRPRRSHHRQAITTAGSGCSAAIDAERWLANANIPAKRWYFGDDWSTNAMSGDSASVTVTDESFAQDVLASNLPVLVDFGRRVAPPHGRTGSRRSPPTRPPVDGNKLDVDANPQTAQETFRSSRFPP